MSWDRAPTRRASAETAAWRAVSAAARASAAWRLARFDCTAAIPPAMSARTRSTAAPPSTILSRRISRACARARVDDALMLGLGVVGGRLEELPLALGEGGALVGAPLERPGQPDAAVELAVRSAQGLPGVRAGGQVVTDPLALDVVVEPPPKPGPLAGQRLVGQGDVAVVAGEQSRADEQLDQALLLGAGDDAVARDPDPRRLALGSGGHQPHQQVAKLVALLGRHAAVHRSRRTGRSSRGRLRSRGSRRR